LQLELKQISASIVVAQRKKISSMCPPKSDRVVSTFLSVSGKIILMNTHQLLHSNKILYLS